MLSVLVAFIFAALLTAILPVWICIWARKKHANKAAYDKLLANKSAIESVLGAALIWNRGDDVNSSKVSYQLNNVSIESETDWLQMANFQAQWSKKFYDVLVPYLR